MRRTSRCIGPIPLASSLLLAACASVGGTLLESGLSALKRTFLGAATSNYGETYRDEFDKVLTALTSVAKDKVQAIGQEPASAPASSSSAGASGTTSSSGGTDSSPAAPAGPALELNFVLLKEEVVDGRSVETPVADGDVLYDRFGSHGEGDNLKLSFRARSACWVYVISIDSTGWTRPLFPSNYTGDTNPVRPETTYSVPPGRNWATLDSYRGVEHVYVLVSRTQRADLEQALTGLAALVREQDPRRALEQQAQVELVTQAAPLRRGWDVARPSHFAGLESSQGTPFSVDAQVFAARGADELVLTRWFRHQ